MKWYIGQNVVCVEKSDLLLKVGNTYEITSLRKCPCSCGGVDIDVSNTINPKLEAIACDCGHIEQSVDGVMWYHESQFRPLDELADISELTEILETTKPFEVLIPEQNSQEE